MREREQGRQHHGAEVADTAGVHVLELYDKRGRSATFQFQKWAVQRVGQPKQAFPPFEDATLDGHGR